MSHLDDMPSHTEHVRARALARLRLAETIVAIVLDEVTSYAPAHVGQARDGAERKVAALLEGATRSVAPPEGAMREPSKGEPWWVE